MTSIILDLETLWPVLTDTVMTIITNLMSDYTDHTILQWFHAKYWLFIVALSKCLQK